MTGMDTKIWGSYKSNFLHVANLATKFIMEEIT